MMDTSSSPAEVTVIGGGPAGAAAARLLALWGHRVVVHTRPSSITGLAESIPPSCAKLFDRLGISAAIEQAGFMRATGNTVWWGDQERVVRFPDGTRGWQVPRDRFDALFLRLAVEAGVEAVSSWDRGSGIGDRGTDQWILDCSGRAGVIARHGYRVAGEGQRTLALSAVWECAVDVEAHTLVESYESGWAWSVPYSGTRRCIAFMVDPELTRITGVSETYHAELARTVRFRELTHGARQVTAPWACDASAYGSSRTTDDGVLLVGDAASFVDPLSSFGIKKALASAWLAAVVTHTGLTEPALESVALQFYEAREREMYESLQRQSAEFSTLAADRHANEFWLERASLEPPAAGGDQDVLAAYEDLKGRASIALRPGAVLARQERPVVRDNRIALATHLTTPFYLKGIRYFRDVDLLTLVDLAAEQGQVPDFYEAYNRAAPPVSLPDFLSALSLSIARGLLQHA